MQNEEEWAPTKYVASRNGLRGSRDKSELQVASRLMADLVADTYGRAFEIHARGRLLDMGCGKAPLYEAYRAHVSDVQCVDWANSPHESSYLDKVCDLSGRIPYPDESFDTIILSDVLEHLPEPAHCWIEMNRLLVPGGKALLNVPFYYQVHEEPHDFYRYTEFALRRFAERSGFQVVQLVPIGGAVEILADLTGKLLSGVKLGIGAIAVQAAAWKFARTRWGAAIMQKTSKRFPFGYFMVVAKG